ncbi:hemocyte protein-glutamine gamma-glutamyltransferase isoform X2 [Cylas formicarius]|uniref:hemocyte protein-glutamine gamma-glutamyltransferase isoform X2 n=1 Tax=Cylas formicarius TaxID=197179 RepID=UPI002958D640|nr:hemocyte protein-glutamine gamma-glutamyltransferase isoform X2 [Cylas formicarius]
MDTSDPLISSPNPHPVKGTKAFVTIDTTGGSNLEQNQKSWACNMVNNQDDTVLIQVYAPPSAPVGLWYLQVETSVKDSGDEASIFEQDLLCYILFNPWNTQDLVYMPEERLLDEYVLNDVGKIWVGPIGTTKGREWVFGQFDAAVLPAIMYMLEKSELPYASHGDAIKVTRMISKMVNSNDDDGILVGRWDGQYDDGTAPAAWTGSAPILQQYLENQSPVNYGQCWVFSGVATTICRALGIPSRVVSNLVSAHDSNGTLSVDKYYNAQNEELKFDPNNENSNSDSIWNYHVWNDVYMARPDLPAGYGGWQAIDATPQETSSGFYQCGPAPLEAIKRGQVGFNFDVPFMIASVNADLMRWKEDPQCDIGFTRIYCNKYHVGKHIFTKKPFIFDHNGDRDREEITTQYKPKEGTEAERLSLLNAVRGTEAAKRFYEMPSSALEDITFDLVDLDKINIGEDFSVVVKVTNKSDNVRSIKCTLSAVSVYYTGVKANDIKKSQGEFKMQPHSEEQLKMTVKGDEYLEKLVEYSNIKMSAIATVVETRQTWADEDDFQVAKPNINIQVPQETVQFVPTKITLELKNPLKKVLTGCKFHISGPSLIRNQILTHADIGPDEKVTVTTEVVPKLGGDEQKIVATFSSKELSDITGSSNVKVVRVQ